MNTTLKLSAAIALSVSFACFNAFARGAQEVQPHHVQVIQLGTIRVTRADAEGMKPAAAVPHYGSTLFLGRIQVTPSDSPDARAAALEAQHSGGVFLGAITVTANDSEEARYAAADAASHGSVYLGSIRVTQPKSAFARGLLAVERYFGSHASLAALGTLVFGRLGG